MALIVAVTRGARAVQNLLAGLPPVAQGAILADALAGWLAKHQGEELRERLLADHIKGVRRAMVIKDFPGGTKPA
jgi:hypothetical protein